MGGSHKTLSTPDFAQEILTSVRTAAAREGVKPGVWLAEAVRFKAEYDEALRAYDGAAHYDRECRRARIHVAKARYLAELEAQRDRDKAEHMAQISLQPAPWPQWAFDPSENRHLDITYYGPRGSELHCRPQRWLNRPDGRNQDIPDKDKMRDWSVFIKHVPLKSADGRERTFKSGDSAIKALYASPEFSTAPKDV